MKKHNSNRFVHIKTDRYLCISQWKILEYEAKSFTGQLFLVDRYLSQAVTWSKNEGNYVKRHQSSDSEGKEDDLL